MFIDIDIDKYKQSESSKKKQGVTEIAVQA